MARTVRVKLMNSGQGYKDKGRRATVRSEENKSSQVCLNLLTLINGKSWAEIQSPVGGKNGFIH